jgi:hypothetical protein
MSKTENQPPDDASFGLRSLEEVIAFEERLMEYVRKRTGKPTLPFSLIPAFQFLHERQDGGRAFTALFDLYVTYVHLRTDL